MLKFAHKRLYTVLIAAIFAFILLIVAAKAFDLNVLSHNPYDSYTRQALAWREGRTYLINSNGELDYLELAVFEGKYYVSFPPVPSVVELVLTLFFDAKTPNQLMLYIYTLVSCVALSYTFARKHNLFKAVCLGALASVGTNLLSIVAFGGVWHEAQCLSFMLCSLAVALILSKNKIYNGLSLFCAALAVGCRPFTVIFIPFLLYHLIKKNEGVKLYRLIPYVIAPACVAILLVWYNMIRFGNPFEFGHNYLPEFLREENGQFHTSYILPNLIQAIKLPLVFEPEIKLNLNQFSANIFYIFNPLIAVFFYYNLKALILKRNIYDFMWLLACALFVVLTCMHKTLGGYQFGARYFIDMIPYLAFYISEQRIRRRFAHVILTIITVCAITLNLYGAHLMG